MTNVWLARQVGVTTALAAWFVAWPLSKLIAILPISLGGAPFDADRLKRLRDLGIVRVSTSVMSEKADKILPILDQWAGLMRQVNG